jgi:hypothetical protein
MSEWLSPRECLSSSQGVFIDIDIITYLYKNSDTFCKNYNRNCYIEVLPALEKLADFRAKSLHGNLMLTRCKV